MDRAEVVRRPPFGGNPQVGARGTNTYRRILAAALEVFGEVGFHDTSVELITEAAGCSRPAVYQYFPSKEDVFWRLAGQLAVEMGELAAGLGEVPAGVEGVTRLREWFGSLIDLYDEYEPVFVAFPSAVREQQVPKGESPAGITLRLGRALLASDGALPKAQQPDGMAAVTITVFLRTIHYWRVGVGGLSRRRFVDGTAQTLHRLLHGCIDGVNAGPVRNPPKKRVPPLPEPPSTGPDRPLRPRGVKTREALLEAGSSVLLARGYHDTRVDDIAEMVGVSRANFYRHFDSKDHLLHVLAQQTARAMVDLFDTFPVEDDPGALRAWMRTWLKSYRSNGGVISAWQEITVSDPELATFSIEVAIVAFDRLNRIVSRRGFGDSAVDAVTLLALVERVPYAALALGTIDERAAVDASVFLIRRGLFGYDGP
jgi:AcrR family transcriptional regulator